MGHLLDWYTDPEKFQGEINLKVIKFIDEITNFSRPGWGIRGADRSPVFCWLLLLLCQHAENRFRRTVMLAAGQRTYRVGRYPGGMHIR